MSTKFKFTVFIIVAFFLIGCGDPSEFRVTKTYSIPETSSRPAIYIVEGNTNTVNYRLSCERLYPCFDVQAGTIYHLEPSPNVPIVTLREQPSWTVVFHIEEESAR